MGAPIEKSNRIKYSFVLQWTESFLTKPFTHSFVVLNFFSRSPAISLSFASVNHSHISSTLLFRHCVLTSKGLLVPFVKWIWADCKWTLQRIKSFSAWHWLGKRFMHSLLLGCCACVSLCGECACASVNIAYIICLLSSVQNLCHSRSMCQ